MREADGTFQSARSAVICFLHIYLPMRLPFGRRIVFLKKKHTVSPVYGTDEDYFLTFLISGMMIGANSMIMQKMMTTNAIGLPTGLNIAPTSARDIR